MFSMFQSKIVKENRKEVEELLNSSSLFLSPIQVEVEDLPHNEVDLLLLQLESQTTSFFQNIETINDNTDNFRWEYEGDSGYGLWKRRYRGGRNNNGTKSGLGEFGADRIKNNNQCISRRGYLGMYNNGKHEGLGESRGPDGSVYRGEWYNNEMHGWGEYITPNGVSFKGKWNHNKLDGRSANDLDEEAQNDKEGIRRRREDEMKEKKK